MPEFFGILRTERRVLLQRPQDERLHRFRNGRVRLALARRHRRLVDVLGEHFHRVLPVERQVPGGHLVEDHADRVEIAALVERRPGGLLGRHVLRRPTDHVVARQTRHVAVEDLGDAEVEHLDEVGLVAPLLDHDVFRLEIAVDDVVRVRFTQRREHLRHDVAEPLLGERPVVAKHDAQVLSLHQLHGDEEPAVGVVAAEVEDADAVGMVEPAGGLGLALEAAHQRGVFEERRLEHLEADHAVERQVPGAVHLAHSALADQLFDLEAARDHLADERIALRARRGAEAQVGVAGGGHGERRAAIDADLGRARRQRACAAWAVCGRGCVLSGGHGPPPGARKA